MPFKLDSADPNLCWASCNKTEGCLAWAYVHPNAWGGNGEGGGRGLQWWTMVVESLEYMRGGGGLT
jgi:hypothetical protein